MLLQGLFVPLTSPFYRDGASYLRKLEHNVGRYSLGPAAGLIALPPRGESAALTDAEVHASLQAVGAIAGQTKVLLAGVERSSVRSSVELVMAAESAGFDAILLSPPTDWTSLLHGLDGSHGNDGRELLAFYETVADRSPLPLVLWSDARPPSLQLPVAVVRSLARHPNILGLLDADLTETRVADVLAETGDIRREVTVTAVFEAVTRRMLRTSAPAAATEMQGLVGVEALRSGTAVASAAVAVIPTVPALKTRTREVGFQVLAATSAEGIVPLLAAGASGAAPWLAACSPQGCFEAYAAWKDGDMALAAERAARLGAASQLLERLGPAAVKAGCDFNGYFGGMPRLPRLPLTADDRSAVEAVLSEIRN